MKRECKILWLPDRDCPFHFEELFLPNSKLEFIRLNQAQEFVKKIRSTVVSNDMKSHTWKDREFVYLDQNKLSPWGDRVGSFIRFHHSFQTICIHTWEGFGHNTPYFSLFEPILKVSERVMKLDRELKLSERVGIHIRATDHFKNKSHRDSYYPPSVFIKLMEKIMRLDPDSLFYVASDDVNVTEEIYAQFEDSVSFLTVGNDRYSLDGTYDALIDAYCLSRTKLIIGNPRSSFSHMAAKLAGAELTEPEEFL